MRSAASLPVLIFLLRSVSHQTPRPPLVTCCSGWSQRYARPRRSYDTGSASGGREERRSVSGTKPLADGMPATAYLLASANSTKASLGMGLGRWYGFVFLVGVGVRSLFAWLISHQPAVPFSQNKPATSNQPAVLFSQNKPAPAIIHQPNEQAASYGGKEQRDALVINLDTAWGTVLGTTGG
jgi:hypothetical protein